ncbi:MAG: hypothetical protein DRJ40_01300 [Thermoprotei archaeon]|mgnify:CR=1 FL=1|nr:MAG: hypothetical protein DRJ40_01300 [Thermoprotei archaeon]
MVSDSQLISLVKMLSKRIIGDDTAEKVLDVLVSRGPMTDEEIAQVSGLHINQVRRILQKLAEEGFITFTVPQTGRVGAQQMWSIDMSALRHVLHRRIREVIEKLRERLRYESELGAYFTCEKCGGHYTMDQAMEFEFRCPLCGDYLIQESTESLVKAINSVIEKLKVAEQKVARSV